MNTPVNRHNSASASPLSSATVTPTNSSPASPIYSVLHSQPHSRQLRPPKGPLYVPAALRPTERMTRSKTASPSPPHSLQDDGSMDHSPQTPPAGLSRRSTADSARTGISKLAEDEWLRMQNLGEVTGLPTREHWKADAASPSCDSPVCKSFFGLFVRRHHCRHCGHVFCAAHTPHVVPLDQNARFHPDGIPSRACDLCWQAYCRWDRERIDRLSQIERDLQANLDERRGRGEDVSLASPIMASDAAARSVASDADNSLLQPDHPGDIVASSVPRDWSWSTF
ncbi:hypothetical protein VTO42DRAFT_1774 [Malbranchea cinnamomea]